MSQPFDASRSLTALEQDSTIIAAIEIAQSKWLVAAVVPGIKRQPLKKLDADEESLLKLLHRWRKEADQAGHPIRRVVVAYEAGRDGFWLARWLRTRGVEAYVIHPNSIAVSREHRRAKTDRLDTELLLRALLGWLRGEKRHCSMVAIPTIEEEDAKRPNRERDSLVTEQTRIGNQIKAILIRFGIRRFRLKLRKAEQQLKELHTGEGSLLPENSVQSSFVTSHVYTWCVSKSERLRKRACRSSKLTAIERKAHTRWSILSRGSSASALRPPTCWSLRSSRVSSATVRRSLATPALPAPQTRAANAGVRRVLPAPVTLASAPA